MSLRTGFTIVELLIVIVVIGILSAVAFISYTGIRERAQITVAKTDIQNIAKQMELFKIDHGRYPQIDPNLLYVELENILRRVGIYEETRWSGDTSTRADRGYLFCQDGIENFYVVAFEPIYTFLRDEGSSMSGSTIYYADRSGVVKEAPLVWNDSISSVSGNLCSTASGEAVWGGSMRWSYSVPSTYAP